MQTDEFLFIPKWLSQDLFIKLLRAGVGVGRRLGESILKCGTVK